LLSSLLASGSAAASERAFGYALESHVLPPGVSELEPWTTWRVGRERYFSRLDARLALEHGLAPGLQAALYWNFSSQSQDVVLDPLTGKIERVSESELAGASLELQYQFSDPAADLLGVALHLESTLGPRGTDLDGKLLADLHSRAWRLVANLGGELELTPLRTAEGTKLETAFVLEPALGAAYLLPHGLSLGLELRAPLGLTGEHKSSTLFGGPVLGFSDSSLWAALAVMPQLVALSGESPDSHLDLEQHERVEVRLLAGFVL
jgi:hypothetical protein